MMDNHNRFENIEQEANDLYRKLEEIGAFKNFEDINIWAAKELIRQCVLHTINEVQGAINDIYYSYKNNTNT